MPGVTACTPNLRPFRRNEAAPIVRQNDLLKG